jgi:sec-independent protein translocase protein TatC
VVIAQAWAFVSPGLYPRERRLVLPVALAAWILALGGIAFGWAVLLPPAASVFLAAVPDGVEPVLSMRAWLRTATTLLGSCALCFQLPLGVFLLARLGLVDARDLVRGFRFGLLGIFALAAVLTPPDVLSQVLLALPLVLLYGVGVLVAAVASTKQRPRAAEPPPG